MDDKERGNILQVEQFNDARATLHQQVVAFTGCGAMKVDVAGTMLVEDEFTDDSTQFHRLNALVEELPHLFACDPDHAAGHHRLDSSLRRTAIEVRWVVNHKLALERKPCDMFPVITEAMCHVLEATTLHEGKSTCRVALALKLVTLMIGDRLALPLAKLPQRLEV